MYRTVHDLFFPLMFFFNVYFIFEQLHESLLLRHHWAFQSIQSRKKNRSENEMGRKEFSSDVTLTQSNVDDGNIVCNLPHIRQAVLSKIRNRHAALIDRALACEQYRSAFIYKTALLVRWH